MRHGRTLKIGKPCRLWNRAERRNSGRDKPKTKRLRPVKPAVWSPEPDTRPTRDAVAQEMDRRRKMWLTSLLIIILAALAVVPWRAVAAWTM